MREFAGLFRWFDQSKIAGLLKFCVIEFDGRADG